MKRYIKLALMAILPFSIASCDGFLDRYPYDTVSANTVFSSPEMAEAAVVAVYSNVLYDYTDAGLARLNWDAFGGTIDPYYDLLYSNYNYLVGTIQPSDASFLTYWKRLYEGINRANDIIDNIGTVPGLSDEIKSRRIAECKFLRAYHYYKLNALWGGVPYYDANLAPSDYTKARSSQDEVWDFIIEDLNDCIECENLPDKLSSSSADFGRITKGAAYALRGKVYMWKKMWKEAQADLEKVGALGYKLLDKPYAEVFKEANETSDEIVFSARMVELSGYGNAFSRTYGSWQVAGNGGNNTFYMNQQFVDSYQCASGKDFNWDDFIPGYSSMAPEARSVYFFRDGMTDSEITAMTNYGADMSKYLPSGNEQRIKDIFASRDPRLLATVITPYTTYSGGFFESKAIDYTRAWPFRKETAPTNDLKTKANTHFYYCIRKMVVEGLDCVNSTYNPTDVPIIRYAQVLLDLAECLNEQGKTNDAVKYVNQVRARAGVGQYNSGAEFLKVSGVDDMRDKIVRERRWELACEEVLYYDELRQGTWKEFRFAKDNGLCEPWGSPEYKYSWGGQNFLLWALPSTEVEKNGNLIQNDGWL